MPELIGNQLKAEIYRLPLSPATGGQAGMTTVEKFHFLQALYKPEGQRTIEDPSFSYPIE